MATQHLYYFLVINKDIQNWNTFDLPLSDNSVFSNGWLDQQFLTDEELKDFNNRLKYQQGIYYKNQEVINITGDDPDDQLQQNFEIKQDGWYEIMLTSAGGGTSESENYFNHDHIYCWFREHVATLQFIKFYGDYSWLYFEEQTNGTITVFKGTYRCTNFVLMLDYEGKCEGLTYANKPAYRQNADGSFSSDIENHGNFLQFIDNLTVHQNANRYPDIFLPFRAAVRATDGTIITPARPEIRNFRNLTFEFDEETEVKENFAYSFLYFDRQVDNTKELFRKLFFTGRIRGQFKARSKDTDWQLDSSRLQQGVSFVQNVNSAWSATNETVYLRNWYIHDAMKFNHSDPWNNFSEGENRILSQNNPTINNAYYPLPEGSGTWIQHYNPNPIILNVIGDKPLRYGGNGGMFHRFLNLEKSTLSFGIGKNGLSFSDFWVIGNTNIDRYGRFSEGLTSGAGSYVQLIENDITVLVAGGGSVAGQNGGYASINNRDGRGSNERGVVFNLLLPEEFQHRLGGMGDNFSPPIASNPDNPQIGFNLNREIEFVSRGKDGRFLYNNSEILGNGLGGNGAGIFRTLTGFNYYRKSESGQFIMRYLGPKSSATYYNILDYDVTPTSDIANISLDTNIKIPAATTLEYKFLFRQNMGIDPGETIVVIDRDEEKLVDDENIPETYLSLAGFAEQYPGTFVLTQITPNIQKLSFVSINKHIKIFIETRLRHYRVFYKDHDDIRSIEGIPQFGERAGREIDLIITFNRPDVNLDIQALTLYGNLRFGLQTGDIQNVTSTYNHLRREQRISFIMPEHDVELLIENNIKTIYKLTMTPRNAINRPASGNLPALQNGIISGIQWGYNIHDITSPLADIDTEVVAGQQIYVKLTLHRRTRIDRYQSTFPEGTIIEREGMNLQSNQFSDNEQWFYFNMPERSINIDLFLELRTYKLILIPDRYRRLNPYSFDGREDYEPGERANIIFEIENYYKLSEKGGLIINNINYPIDLNDKRMQIQCIVRFDTDTRANGYFVDYVDNDRIRFPKVESVQFNIIFRNSDIQIFFDLTYLKNSTLFCCGQTVTSNVRIIVHSILRLMIAGSKSGDGGKGTDGGPTPRRSNSQWHGGASAANALSGSLRGLMGGAGGSGFIGGDGGAGVDAAGARFFVVTWQGFLPYDLRILQEDGGGGGPGGHGFIGGGAGAGGGQGSASWSGNGFKGEDGRSFLHDNNLTESNNHSIWRGVLVDCLIEIEEGIIYIATGGNGGNGSGGPGVDQGEWGNSGAGGGAGGPSYFYSPTTRFVILSHNPICATFLNKSEGEGTSLVNQFNLYQQHSTLNFDMDLNQWRRQGLNREVSVAEFSAVRPNAPDDFYKGIIASGSRVGRMIFQKTQKNGSHTQQREWGNVPPVLFNSPVAQLSPGRNTFLVGDERNSNFMIWGVDTTNEPRFRGYGFGGGAGPAPIPTNPGNWYLSCELYGDNLRMITQFNLAIGGRRGFFPNLLFIGGALQTQRILLQQAASRIPSLYVYNELTRNVALNQRIDWAYNVGFEYGGDLIPFNGGGCRIIFLGERRNNIAISPTQLTGTFTTYNYATNQIPLNNF